MGRAPCVSPFGGRIVGILTEGKFTHKYGLDPYSGTYSALYGWTDIRYFFVSLNTYQMDMIIKPGATVPEIARETGAELAVNGPFAYGSGIPLGYIVKDEKLMNDTTAVVKWADFILYQNGNIQIGQLDKNELQGIRLSFSSTPQIVKNGKLYVNTAGEGTPRDVYANRRPRTGIGFTKDNRVLIVVVDGDSVWNAGLRVDELGAVMIKLGAMEALNCDGGGSSVLVQNGKAISAIKGTRRLGAAIVFKPDAS
jgi:exopolysaccharide biosynthesis protein